MGCKVGCRLVTRTTEETEYLLDQTRAACRPVLTVSWHGDRAKTGDSHFLLPPVHWRKSPTSTWLAGHKEAITLSYDSPDLQVILVALRCISMVVLESLVP